MGKLIITPSSHSLFNENNDVIWTPKKDLLFRIKKYTDLFIHTPIRSHVNFGGFYRLQAVNSLDGRERWLTDWFHNKTTKYGLNRLRNSDQWNRCQVGTGNVPPAEDGSDTTLQSFLAGSGAAAWITTVRSGAPLYYTTTQFKYTFATGATAGNISEIGIGPSASSGTSLYSRELIRDAGGDPTTITLSSTETLIVYYSVSVYPPLEDTVFDISGTIGGNPEVRTVTNRACSVNQGDADQSGSWCPRNGNGGIGGLGVSPGNSSIGLATTGLIAITSGAGQLANTNTSITAPAYVTDSFTSSFVATWNTTKANVSILRALYPTAYTENMMQAAFDTPIVKTNLQTLTLTFQVSWGEYTP